jgi:hypothetical protein
MRVMKIELCENCPDEDCVLWQHGSIPENCPLLRWPSISVSEITTFLLNSPMFGPSGNELRDWLLSRGVEVESDA